MYLLWGKSRQKGLKVVKYCAKVALVCETGELMAANQCMGNTEGVSTVLEHTERAVRNA